MNPCPKRKPLRLKGKALHDLYQFVLMRSGGECQCPFCKGGSPIDRAPHHIIFKSQGGPDEAWNLVTICMDCHDKIHNRGTLKIEVVSRGSLRVEIEWVDKTSS